MDKSAAVKWPCGMTYQSAALSDHLNTLPKLPGWVTSGGAETLETVVFQSGAALTVLDVLMTGLALGVPLKLFANRLELKAATATSKIEGRLAREGASVEMLIEDIQAALVGRPRKLREFGGPFKKLKLT